VNRPLFTVLNENPTNSERVLCILFITDIIKINTVVRDGC